MTIASRSKTWSAALGLALMPLVAGVAAYVVPRAEMGEDVANLFVFGGASLSAIGSVAIAANAPASWRARVSVAVAAACLLVLFAVKGVASTSAALVVDSALVALAWGIGSWIGGGIQHPGHLLPACGVVAFADLASVVSSLGPSHAIAKSERALSIVAISFPIPGTSAFAPALGVGDLVFMSIVFGAVAQHGLSVIRAASLCALGTCVAGAASAWWGVAVPALVPIGVALVVGLPAVRKLRREDRRVAALAVVIAASIATATVVGAVLEPKDPASRMPSDPR